MDLGTVIGLVVGSVLLLWALSSGGSLGTFIDFPSILITVGGTVAATLIHFPLKQVLKGVQVARNAFTDKTANPLATIESLVTFASRARREGLLALEEAVLELEDPFLRKGLQLVIDGTDAELVRTILDTEVSFLETRHKNGAALFDGMAMLAPAFGLIGTLVGLVQMLGSLDDPSKIGPGMAVAMLTTFYGAVMANFIFVPLAGKLRLKSAAEIFNREIMIEGILSIQAGDSPRIVEEKLKSYLPPTQRQAPPDAQAAEEEAIPDGAPR